MKVLLVDDDPTMRDTLGEIARRAFGDVRIRTASTLTEGLQQARAANELDLVLLDLALPGCSGIDALAHFRREFPLVRVLVVSALEDRACVMAALEAGAAGYLPKTSPLLTMLAAVRLVSQGGTYIPPQAFAPDAFTPLGLTDREIDVLRLLAQGRNDKDIAYALGIAEGSARQHVKDVFRTLGASSRGEAVVIAARCGVRLDERR
jgi:DNA-binding NarL/FixJ family response regulator